SENRMRSLVAVGALGVVLFAGRAAAAAPAATPTRAPTAVPTPQPPDRLPASPHRGAVTERRVARYENRHVTFSRLTRVEEVDLDGDGVFEALVEGIGTVRSFPAEVPAVAFVSRARPP